jgi:hypothetical protein
VKLPNTTELAKTYQEVDHLFEDAHQAKIFDDLILPMVNKALEKKSQCLIT